MRVNQCVRAAAAAVLLALAGCASDDSTQGSSTEPASTESAMVPSATVAKPHPLKVSALSYHDSWRRLWEDHITWTRMVIIGISDSLPGTDFYVRRLLQNYVDMEDALRPYYGEQAALFSELLQEHLTIAADILVAAKAGNDDSLGRLLEEWRTNADALATQMNAMNPRNWPLEETRAMWHEHLDVTLAEATAHLSGDFSAELEAWEQVHDGGLMMADLMSNGVIRQFRGAFFASGQITCN
jgi:hypothetical protein